MPAKPDTAPLSRKETMFWESAYVVAILVGVGSGVLIYRTTPSLVGVPLVAFFGPWSLVWLARRIWLLRRPRHKVGDVLDLSPNRYRSQDHVSLEMHEAAAPHLFIIGMCVSLLIWGAFAFGVLNGWSGDVAVLGAFMFSMNAVGFFVQTQWSLRSPWVNIPDRPKAATRASWAILLTAGLAYMLRWLFAPIGQFVVATILGAAFGVAFFMAIRHAKTH